MNSWNIVFWVILYETRNGQLRDEQQRVVLWKIINHPQDREMRPISEVWIARNSRNTPFLVWFGSCEDRIYYLETNTFWGGIW